MSSYVGMLALDLGVFQRTAHAVTMREAAAWSTVWILLALAFAGGIWKYWHLWHPALQMRVRKRPWNS